MGRTGMAVGAVALVLAGQAHVSPTASSSARSYRVVKGDHLGAIAARLRVQVADLVRANNLASPDRIRAGQVLVVPTVTSRPPDPAPPVSAPTMAPLDARRVVLGGGGERHRVAPGETLSVIARRYGTSVGQLVEQNDLADANRIVAGREVEVPGDPWLCPVPDAPRFVDTWGSPRDGARRHLGTDIFSTRGTPVVANVGGTVSHAAGSRAGLAYYLRGDDGHTYYGAHLDELRPAGRVERGGDVGTVGSTGNAQGTAPHLHFEIKPGGGDPVNPYFTLERWC